MTDRGFITVLSLNLDSKAFIVLGENNLSEFFLPSFLLRQFPALILFSTSKEGEINRKANFAWRF